MNDNFSRYAAFFDYISQPIFAVQDGEVIYCNPAASRAHVCLGANIDSFLADDMQTLPDAPAHLSVILSGEPCSASLQSVDGVQLLIANAPAGDTMSADTLFSVAQSLRAPLSNLFGTASTLFPLLEELENPTVQAQIASLNRAFYQLLHLTCNLSEMRAALSDELPLRLEKTELCNFFYDLFERVQPLCKTRGVTLTCSIPQQQFYAWIDRQRIERAVLNVLANSLKFTPDGGTIQLRLEHTNTSAMLRITDDGEGFDREALASAFSRYDRPLQLGDPRWGVGFGLPLVRRIAQQHGGSLIVQSEPGKGTSVCMSLSLRKPAEDESALNSPIATVDYTGGYSHILTELADVLPLEVYDSMNVN